MKKNKKAKKNNVILYLLLAVALVAAVIVVALRLSRGDGEPAAEPAMPGVSTPAPADSVSIDLGSGLEITNISRFAGSFIEDGSDDVLSDVCAITVKNTPRPRCSMQHITLTGGEGAMSLT